MSDPRTSDPDRTTGGRSTLGRLGVLAVVASFVGIWGYVVYLSVFEGRAEPRDRLDDQAWTATAEQACQRSATVFESLPVASEASSPAERADLLEPATDELEVMIDRLEAIGLPEPADEADAVERWLADYRTFATDRREYEAAQRDPDHPRYDEPFSVTDRGGYQIDVLIDDFARVNYMESCETPDDLG